MTTEKTIALTIQTFVGKVIPLLFSMLSRWIIAFLPRSKHLLISWLQITSVVILEPPCAVPGTPPAAVPGLRHAALQGTRSPLQPNHRPPARRPRSPSPPHTHTPPGPASGTVTCSLKNPSRSPLRSGPGHQPPRAGFSEPVNLTLTPPDRSVPQARLHRMATGIRT